MAPPAPAYHLGEPLAVRLVLKNTSGKKVGMEFLCIPTLSRLIRVRRGDGAAVAAHPERPGRLPLHSAGRGFPLCRCTEPIFDLPEKSAIRRRVHSSLRSERAPPRKDRAPTPRPTTPRRRRSTLQSSRENRRKWIKAIAAVLDGKDKQASMGKDKISKDEAVELLCWADTPLVVEPLIAVAGPEIAQRLARTRSKRFRRAASKKMNRQERRFWRFPRKPQRHGGLSGGARSFEKEGVLDPASGSSQRLALEHGLHSLVAGVPPETRATRGRSDLVEPSTNSR